MISAGTSLPIAQECCLKCPACGALKDARSKADRAVKARSAARSEIVRVCAQSVKLLGGGTIAEGKAMPSWDLTGNAGTTDANFLGTKDRRPLVIKTNNSEAMRIEPGGKVGIGTMEPNAPLQIGSDTYTQDSKIILDAGNGAQRRAWSMGVPYGDTTVTSPNYGFVIRDETGERIGLLLIGKPAIPASGRRAHCTCCKSAVVLTAISASMGQMEVRMRATSDLATPRVGSSTSLASAK